MTITHDVLDTQVPTPLLKTSGGHIGKLSCSDSYHLLLGRYSPDGQTIGCLQCPEGYTTEGTGAESLDDCLGIVLHISL